MSIFI